MKITPTIFLDEAEIKLIAIRAPGPGGQNVNKVATAIQLRFNVRHSCSLPESVRIRLLTLLGKQLTQEGVWIIKASRHRTQERNKQDALNRLKEGIKRAAIIPKKRKKTQPRSGSVEKRLRVKKSHAQTKKLRQAIKGNSDS